MPTTVSVYVLFQRKTLLVKMKKKKKGKRHTGNKQNSGFGKRIFKIFLSIYLVDKYNLNVISIFM